MEVTIWRTISDEGGSPCQVRVSIGAWPKSGAIAMVGKNLLEESFKQFTAKDVAALLRFIDRMDSVEFQPADERIKYRAVEGSFRGMRFWRYPNRPVEVFVMQNGELGETWAAIDVLEFNKLFSDVIASKATFDRMPASVRFKPAKK